MEAFVLITHSHTCYYQVQTQNFVIIVFVLFQLELNQVTIWTVSHLIVTLSSCIDTSTHFFTSFVLPELLGKWYTELLVSTEGHQVNTLKLSISFTVTVRNQRAILQNGLGVT